jgi:hypothetical protein
MFWVTCIGSSWRADFGEAQAVILPPSRSCKMSYRYKVRKNKPARAPMPQQKAMAFESRLTRSLIGSERIKVIRQLAHLLMLAAGMTIEESDRER